MTQLQSSEHGIT